MSRNPKLLLRRTSLVSPPFREASQALLVSNLRFQDDYTASLFLTSLVWQRHPVKSLSLCHGVSGKMKGWYFGDSVPVDLTRELEQFEYEGDETLALYEFLARQPKLKRLSLSLLDPVHTKLPSIPFHLTHLTWRSTLYFGVLTKLIPASLPTLTCLTLDLSNPRNDESNSTLLCQLSVLLPLVEVLESLEVYGGSEERSGPLIQDYIGLCEKLKYLHYGLWFHPHPHPDDNNDLANPRNTASRTSSLSSSLPFITSLPTTLESLSVYHTDVSDDFEINLLHRMRGEIGGEQVGGLNRLKMVTIMECAPMEVWRKGEGAEELERECKRRGVGLSLVGPN